MKHQIKIFKTKSEARLTELVNEWLEDKTSYRIIDIKFTMTSNLMSNGREIHTYCAMIHYYDISLDDEAANKLYKTLFGGIERRGEK